MVFLNKFKHCFLGVHRNRKGEVNKHVVVTILDEFIGEEDVLHSNSVCRDGVSFLVDDEVPDLNQAHFMLEDSYQWDLNLTVFVVVNFRYLLSGFFFALIFNWVIRLTWNKVWGVTQDPALEVFLISANQFSVLISHWNWYCIKLFGFFCQEVVSYQESINFGLEVFALYEVWNEAWLGSVILALWKDELNLLKLALLRDISVLFVSLL